MALPTLNSTPVVDDSPEATEYKEAINQAIESLGNRSGTNWFSIAGQLLNPGRSGRFSEALSNTATEVGRQQEEQRKEEPAIAQMRAQLAGTNYQLASDTKAMDNLTKIMGAPTSADAMGKLQSGDIDLTTANRLAQSMPLFVNSPKVAGLVKNVIDAQTGVAKANADVSQAKTGENRYRAEYDPTFSFNNGNAVPVASPFQLPVQGGTITSPYGNRQDPFNKDKTEFHQGIDIGGKEGSPVNSVISGVVSKVENSDNGFGNRVSITDPKTGYTTYYAHLADSLVKEGQEVKTGSPIGILGSTGRSTGPHVEFGVLTPEGKHADPSLLFQKGQAPQNAQKPTSGAEPSGMSVAGQQAVLKEQAVAGNKQYNTMRDALTGEMPDAFVTSNAQLDRLHNIATRKDANQIFGVLQAGDEDSFVKKLAKIGMSVGDEGVTVGDIGHLKTNFDSLVRNSTLKTEQKAAASEAANILANQVIMNLKTSRQSAFGARLTNYEDMQMQAVNSNMGNIPQFIDKWAAQRKLENSKNLAVRDAYSDWVNEKGENYANTHLNEFFNSKQSPFRQIPEKYAQYYSYLSNNYKYKPQQ